MKRLTKEEFIIKAIAVHGYKYNYSKVEYVNNSTKICIICPFHGEFWQRPNDHLNGSGCPECKAENSGKHNIHFIKSAETFISQAISKHGPLYGYKKLIYLGCRKKVCITCEKHGDFWQMPLNHLHGHGCPICSKKKSSGERELFDFVKSMGLNVVRGDRNIIGDGREVDIYIPSARTAIEYNGISWHSEKFGGRGDNYHLSKTELLAEKGVHLIHIFEDEWGGKKDAVKSYLKNLLITPRTEIANEFTFEDVTTDVKNRFLDINHIRGRDDSAESIGAFYKDSLVAIMTFSPSQRVDGDKNVIEILRFSTSQGVNLQCAAEKLLNHYEKTRKPYKIISHIDRRWESGELYKSLGFIDEKRYEPDYWYVKLGKGCGKNRGKKLDRLNFTREKIEERFGESFSPEVTEWQIMESKGWDRIWDCGSILFSKTIVPSDN